MRYIVSSKQSGFGLIRLKSVCHIKYSMLYSSNETVHFFGKMFYDKLYVLRLNLGAGNLIFEYSRKMPFFLRFQLIE